MPRIQKSIEAQIAEHERYRRQCKVRIKPSMQLCALALLISGFLLWHEPEQWGLAVVVAAAPLLFTGMEVWGYFRHDRAIRQLTVEQRT